MKGEDRRDGRGNSIGEGVGIVPNCLDARFRCRPNQVKAEGEEEPWSRWGWLAIWLVTCILYV